MEFYEYSRDVNKYPVCWLSDNPDCYPHFHKSIEVVYVAKGSISALLDRKKYTVSQGQILVVPGYMIHSFTREADAQTWICTIPMDAVPAFGHSFNGYTFASYIINLDEQSMDGGSSEQALIFECFREIQGYLEREHTLAGQLRMNGCACMILGWLVEHAGMIPVVRSQSQVFARDVLVYLEEHYLEYCDLEEISRNFGYSKSRFSHIFNETFGCRLVEFINGLRCAHAMELMKTGEKTITDIALESGFETTRTFYRAFRKHYGASPRKARRAS